jgi:hypothetical protein
MPVAGPDLPDKDVVNSAYKRVHDYLANVHGIQRDKINPYVNTQEEREKRNKALYDAIYNLFELEEWESF